MTHWRASFAIGCLLLQHGSAYARPSNPPLSAEALRRHVEFLASERLLGRGTPSAGLDLAARYVAKEFRSAGLLPGGDHGFFSISTYQGATVRNVVGFVRGSDRDLRRTCVLVTAHYDHLGFEKDGKRIRVYRGANDNASGVASLIEMARQLRLSPRPRRSIVFVAFWGEEEGGLGAEAYHRRPTFPLRETVANINLDQVGVVVGDDGVWPRSLLVTGEPYSSIGPLFETEGRKMGVKIRKHGPHMLFYFSRCDNAVFAELGIPSHTLCTTFDFPDYHDFGDIPEKLDYQNMGFVDRLILRVTTSIANDSKRPQWNTTMPETELYRAAQRRLMGSPGHGASRTGKTTYDPSGRHRR